MSVWEWIIIITAFSFVGYMFKQHTKVFILIMNKIEELEKETRRDEFKKDKQ